MRQLFLQSVHLFRYFSVLIYTHPKHTHTHTTEHTVPSTKRVRVSTTLSSSNHNPSSKHIISTSSRPNTAPGVSVEGVSVRSFIRGAAGNASLKQRLEALRHRAHTGRWEDALLHVVGGCEGVGGMGRKGGMGSLCMCICVCVCNNVCICDNVYVCYNMCVYTTTTPNPQPHSLNPPTHHTHTGW